MLKVRNVSKQFQGPRGQVVAIDDVSLDVAAGEFVSLQGPSGCGKTTLLLAIGALQRVDSGVITIDGQDPYALRPEARAAFRASHIGFVFQQYHLVPYLSVMENVLAPTLARPLADAHAKARTLLSHLGLTDRADHRPAALSAGERQRVAMARALLNRPRLLLADEPTGNLDTASAEAILQALSEFAADGGTVLLVTHDPRAASRAGRIIGMKAGKLTDAAPALPDAAPGLPQR